MAEGSRWVAAGKVTMMSVKVRPTRTAVARDEDLPAVLNGGHCSA